MQIDSNRYNNFKVVNKNQARASVLKEAARITGDPNIWKRLTFPVRIPEAWIMQWVEECEKLPEESRAIRFNYLLKKSKCTTSTQ